MKTFGVLGILVGIGGAAMVIYGLFAGESDYGPTFIPGIAISFLGLTSGALLWFLGEEAEVDKDPSGPNSGEPIINTTPNVGSGETDSDQLRKYKSLLDDGLITEEEYQTKKEQILGLE